MITRYDYAYMDMAVRWSKLSYARRMKVGALIVSKDGQIISDGYNGTPAGFDNNCEGRDGKTLPHVIHAESNALTKLARSTQSSVGASLYCTLAPCIQCAKLIAQSGIDRVIFLSPYAREGLAHLKKCGVEVVHLQE